MYRPQFCLLLSLLSLGSSTTQLDVEQRNPAVLELNGQLASLPINEGNIVLSSLQGRDCKCKDGICGCCFNLDIGFIGLHEEVCLKFEGIRDDYILMHIVHDGKDLIKYPIRDGNTPPICVPLAGGAVKACVRLKNLLIRKGYFYVCPALGIKIPIFKETWLRAPCIEDRS